MIGPRSRKMTRVARNMAPCSPHLWLYSQRTGLVCVYCTIGLDLDVDEDTPSARPASTSAVREVNFNIHFLCSQKFKYRCHLICLLGDKCPFDPSLLVAQHAEMIQTIEQVLVDVPTHAKQEIKRESIARQE